MRDPRPSAAQADTPRFSIRPATEDDLPAILEIERAAYPKPWTREAFRVEMRKPFSRFLALTDDETDSVVAGYIVYWVLFDECHILNLAVAMDWRGLGHGTLLVRHAVNETLAAGKKKVFLEVRKSNAGAIALYQKLGFFIDHVKKSFYEDGEAAYFMMLYLQEKNRF